MKEFIASANPLRPIILRHLSSVTAQINTPYKALIHMGGLNVDVNAAHKRLQMKE